MTKSLGRLSARDAVTALCAAVALNLYVGHLNGTGPQLTDPVPGMAVAALILAVAGYSAGVDESVKVAPGKWIATVLGSIALIAFVVTVVTGAAGVLAVFMASLGLLWAATTVPHLIGTLITTARTRTGQHKG
ncbi:hypothetical protein [Actinorhabdospora filicis]|uniref:hypothetical protein n=1 Tax=Actinorhabdospora filicis TaxID=1785913 RepID=UPI002552F507|nr:hypothetical protein [Actinorhabdospora filicis]